VGFFLHVPFPHFEILRALPRAPQLVRALLAYDVVGFQTESDRDSFLGCVRLMCGIAPDEEGTLPVGGHLCRAAVFPIGVDVEGVNSVADRAQAAAPVRRMVEGLGGRRLIIGVDRLDYSKGLLERFEAYRKFLEDASEHAGRVTYLQIAPLGRQDVQAYAQIRNSLEQSSGRTNGRFAEADWTPIRYLNRNFPHATLLGFLRASDVCLVTPVRDGMNLVAKEFIASQDPADPGVLILSDRAGAAAELSAAVIVNPYDTKGIARAIRLALAMPVAERRERHERLLGALHRNDIHRWHREFVVSLARSR
jgi:trehalose 6-phosphate synthase